MKLFLWTVETVVVEQVGKNTMYTFKIETFDDSKQNAMDIARMRVKRMLERERKPYVRIVICWIQLMEVVQRTKYEEYTRLYETGKTKKSIARLLDIPFWKVDEFHRRYRKERYKKRRNPVG